MNYHDIKRDDMLNGDGLRATLFVSGCAHHCKDCQNPITWDTCGGIPFDQSAKDEIFDLLSKEYIAGLTLSGGDPLHPENVNEVTALCRECKEFAPNKNIWCYTGYLWEHVRHYDIMQYVDVLVDGEFYPEQKSPQAKWVGSSNQRVIDVPTSLALGKVVLHP